MNRALPWVYRSRKRFVIASVVFWTTISLAICIFMWGDRWGIIESIFGLTWGLLMGLWWGVGMWKLFVAPRTGLK
jgi:hypothetical protein